MTATDCTAETSVWAETCPARGTDTHELHGVVTSPLADRMMVVAVLCSAPGSEWQRHLDSAGARAVLGDLRPRFATDRLIIAVPPNRTRPAVAALAVAVDVITGLIRSSSGGLSRPMRTQMSLQ